MMLLLVYRVTVQLFQVLSVRTKQFNKLATSAERFTHTRCQLF